MRIDYLEECIKLANAQSYTQAAKELYLSQSVLSKHVAAVENEVGAELFARSAHGVSLTKAGKAFIEGAAEVVRAYDATLMSVETVVEAALDSLSVGYLIGASWNILPKAAAIFRDRNRDTNLRFEPIEYEDMLSILESDQADVLIASTFGIEGALESERFKWVSLYEDALCACVPVQHQLANKEVLCVEDFRGIHLLLPSFSVASATSRNTLNYLRPVEDSVHIRRTSHDFFSSKLALLSQNLVGISFKHLEEVYESDDFVFIPIEDYDYESEIIALWKTANTFDMLEEFVDILKQCAENMRAQ